MARVGGVITITDADGGVVEYDSATCAHCSRVFRIKHGTRAEDCGGWCRLCAKVVCAGCAGGPCVPLEKRLEAMEAAGRARRSYGF